MGLFTPGASWVLLDSAGAAFSSHLFLPVEHNGMSRRIRLCEIKKIYVFGLSVSRFPNILHSAGFNAAHRRGAPARETFLTGTIHGWEVRLP